MTSDFNVNLVRVLPELKQIVSSISTMGIPEPSENVMEYFHELENELKRLQNEATMSTFVKMVVKVFGSWAERSNVGNRPVLDKPVVVPKDPLLQTIPLNDTRLDITLNPAIDDTTRIPSPNNTSSNNSPNNTPSNNTSIKKRKSKRSRQRTPKVSDVTSKSGETLESEDSDESQHHKNITKRQKVLGEKVQRRLEFVKNSLMVFIEKLYNEGDEKISITVTLDSIDIVLNFPIPQLDLIESKEKLNSCKTNEELGTFLTGILHASSLKRGYLDNVFDNYIFYLARIRWGELPGNEQKTHVEFFQFSGLQGSSSNLRAKLRIGRHVCELLEILSPYFPLNGSFDTKLQSILHAIYQTELWHIHHLANDDDAFQFNQHLKECLEGLNLTPKA